MKVTQALFVPVSPVCLQLVVIGVDEGRFVIKKCTAGSDDQSAISDLSRSMEKQEDR